jgi:hypothetical protein
MQLSIACLAAACQNTPPPFPDTISVPQQQELTAIYDAVWDQAMAMRRANGGISKPAIRLLVEDQDTQVKDSLDDAQWLSFDNTYRDDWIDRIYNRTRPRTTTVGSGKSPTYKAGPPTPNAPGS